MVQSTLTVSPTNFLAKDMLEKIVGVASIPRELGKV